MAVQVTLADTPKAWVLDSAADLHAAAVELHGLGYRGAIAFWHEVVDGTPTGDPVWSLSVSPEQGVGAEVVAHVGDRLLLSGGVLQKLTAAEFAQVVA